MMKPVPLEEDWLCWPKTLYFVPVELMDTTLLTVLAYTWAGVIISPLSTCLTVTATSSAVWVAWLTEVLLVWNAPYTAAPPKPHRPDTRAHTSTRATAFTPRPCLGAGPRSVWGAASTLATGL